MNVDSIIKKYFQIKVLRDQAWANKWKWAPKNIQSFETSIETGNLQSYDKQSTK